MLTLLPTPPQRLLLVEADEAVSDTLQRSLRRAGWDVLHAPTAGAALRLKPGFAPGLVLASLVLPDMGGRQLVERLARDRDCAVVVMSGLGEDARRAALASGAQDCLPKPLVMRDMLERLQAAMQRWTEAHGGLPGDEPARTAVLGS